MQQQSKNMFLGLAVLGASAAVGSALVLKGELDEPRAIRNIHAHGYVVDLTLEEQLKFPGTLHAFQGVVTDVLEPRYVELEGLEYVYTPIVVTVTKVHKGEPPASKKVTLRVFGGTAEGVHYDADFAPSDEVANRGVQLLVLGPDPVAVAGDGLLALTPNGVHVLHGQDVIDVTHKGEHRSNRTLKMDLASAESLLSSK